MGLPSYMQSVVNRNFFMRRIPVFVLPSPSGVNINTEDAAVNISHLHSVRFIYVQYRSRAGYIHCATVWAIKKPDLDYGQGKRP
jgi:hypothetical protein